MMSEQNNKLPIGLLLKNAGLISDEQLQNALEMQAQYSQMKLGEILVLQQGLKAKTIDFFVDCWQEILTQGQILPLGFYLRQADLLDAWQIEIILQEQKSKRDKFGELAVEKGWIERDTINFFINNLSPRPPVIMSLSMLEIYNFETLHLEKKYANYSLILSRTIAWTGGIPVLTKTICHVFANSNSNIPGGQEIKAVDRFIEGTLIGKWQTSKEASSIRMIAHSLLKNHRCSSELLLAEYQSILLAGVKTYRDTREQKELILLGLIIKQDSCVRISNIIYQHIFNREFIIQQLNKIQSKDIQTTSSKSTAKPIETVVEYVSEPEVELTSPPVVRQVVNLPLKAVANTFEDNSDSEKKNNVSEPLTKISSIVTGVAIALSIPLFLTINSYYSTLSNGKPTTNSFQEKVDRLQQSCSQSNSSDLISLLNSISNLELAQQQLQQNFPDNCRVALNRLRLAAAPQLGKESRILEAIRHLCKVPPDSEMYIEAEVWLKRWYGSSSWGEETKFYLEEIDKYDGKSCPAAHFTEYEV